MKIYRSGLSKNVYIILYTEPENVDCWTILPSLEENLIVIEIISLQYHKPGHFFPHYMWLVNAKQLITREPFKSIRFYDVLSNEDQEI